MLRDHRWRRHKSMLLSIAFATALVIGSVRGWPFGLLFGLLG